jgi:hypothetical protein
MGWVISSPTAGDVDGDGLVEVIATTREGNVFVWDTPAPASSTAIPWQGFGRDRRNTQNHESGVSPLAAPRAPLEALVWVLQSIERSAGEILAGTPLGHKSLVPIAFPHVISQVEDSLASGAPLASSGFLLAAVSLATPPAARAALAPLRLELLAGVGDAAERQLEAIACDPGDKACRTCRGKVESMLQLADRLAGSHQYFPELDTRARALSLALSCQ